MSNVEARIVITVCDGTIISIELPAGSPDITVEAVGRYVTVQHERIAVTEYDEQGREVDQYDLGVVDCTDFAGRET